jgi:type IX secretion system PorP/SprF family membrane protein
MKKKLIIFPFLVLGSVMSFAQQIPFYCQYYINPFIYNPAYTGNGASWDTYLIHRSQWTDIPGAPVTSALTLDGPVKDKKVGVGLSLYNDVTGLTSRIGAYGAYSYRMNISDASRLYLGLSVGVLNNSIDFSKERVKDINEPTIAEQFDNKTVVDGSFGIKYELNRLEISAAVPQILGNSLSYVNLTDARSYYNLHRHYMGSLRYTFTVHKEKNITAYPLVLVRAAENIPLQYDINAVLDWKSTGWLAVSYKNDYAVSANLGVRLNGFSIGYVYDIMTGPLSAYTGSSSEILIGYSFRVGEKKPERNYEETLNALSNRVKQLQEENERDKSELDSLKARLKAMEFNKNVAVEVGARYRLSNVNFATKSYDLNRKSRKILDELVEFLEKNPTVKIDIHENRAKSVMAYLVEKGIDSERLSYKAFGESKLLIPQTDPNSRAVNRRTEFEIIEK